MHDRAALNAICPYFTMFPLDFPLRVLKRRKPTGGWVVDPFCGRGTTNFAARLMGFPTAGVDSSPIAAAIAQAKIADASADDVDELAQELLQESEQPQHVPRGQFWRWMYHPKTLREICTLREALLLDCSGDCRAALRAIVLGALHGPRTKTVPSYLSNQCPRTYAPKPRYSLTFWKERGLDPPRVHLLDVVRIRAERYLAAELPSIEAEITCGDSRQESALPNVKVALAITSPPYYGMRTYIADQWIRNWFLGGPPAVQYSQPDDSIGHSSPEAFASDLRSVWRVLAERATPDAALVVRFGGIKDRKADPVGILKESLQDSGWRLRTRVSAGRADKGKRQSDQFLKDQSTSREEFDYYAMLA